MQEGGQNFLKEEVLGVEPSSVCVCERERDNERLGRFLGMVSQDLVFPRPTSYMLTSFSFHVLN